MAKKIGPTKQGLLLKALRDGRSVSHATAMIDLKIPNLNAVISDLRDLGHRIEKETHLDVTGQPYTAWVLVGAVKVAA